MPRKPGLVGGVKGHNINEISFPGSPALWAGSFTFPPGLGSLNTMDVETLKNYFKNRDDVAFAFLYGSQAKGKATQLSDVDIAVYFYPERRHPVEFEEEVFYKGEDQIWSDMEKATKKEVELLVLNRVPSTVAASAIRVIPLAIKDHETFETLSWKEFFRQYHLAT